MTEGVDYSTARPSPAAMYAAGIRFVMRYIGPGSDDKHLHPAERDALLSAGLSIALLAEGWESDPLRGQAQGQTHARAAAADAASLRVPSEIPIYFAVDFDVTAGQWPAVASYLRGAASIIGVERVGLYGPVWALQWAFRDGVARYFFQAYAPAWSGGLNNATYANADVKQYRNNVTLAGGQVDLCRAMTTNFGQWPQPNGDTPMQLEDTPGKPQASQLQHASDYSAQALEHIEREILPAIIGLKDAVGKILDLLSSAGSPDVAAIRAAIKPEIRDAVADLGEGGAAQVRADAP